MADQRIIDTASNLVSTSTRTTMGASGAGVLAWFANFDWIALLGLAIGIFGLLISCASFLVNWHYKRKEDQRSEILHQLQIKRVKGDYRHE